MKPGNTVLVGFLLSLLLGCGKSEQPRTPVARVDEEILTLEAIMARFDTTKAISQAQVHEYIERWLLNELLYREAVRRGLDRRDDTESKVQDARRTFAINALLDEEVYSRTSADINPEEIRKYYETNRPLFLLTEDVAYVSMVVFGSRDAANAFRTTVLRGKPWTAAKRELLENPEQSELVGGSVDSVHYTSRTLLPQELWRVATGIARGEPSFPVRTDEGFFVLIVWRIDRTGAPADFPYVSEEIKSRLTIQKRQQAYEEFVEGLRSKHSVQVLLSPVESQDNSTGTNVNKRK